jgi:hypothetical protein
MTINSASGEFLIAGYRKKSSLNITQNITVQVTSTY